MKGQSQSEAAQRRALIAAAQAMNGLGINQGTAGNLSLRCNRDSGAGGAGLLITPSGVPYAALAPADIVWMDQDGVCDGRLKPSSEWRFHRDILAARPEFQAIVHTHAVHATALACHGRDIPPFHYMVAAAGGADIRCAPYATFGSADLSRHAVAALQDRKACLLAHHGMIVGEASLDRALALAVEVETLARQYLAASVLGPPPLLSAAEMARVVAKFATYGKQSLRDQTGREQTGREQ